MSLVDAPNPRTYASYKTAIDLLRTRYPAWDLPDDADLISNDLPILDPRGPILRNTDADNELFDLGLQYFGNPTNARIASANEMFDNVKTTIEYSRIEKSISGEIPPGYPTKALIRFRLTSVTAPSVTDIGQERRILYPLAAKEEQLTYAASLYGNWDIYLESDKQIPILLKEGVERHLWDSSNDKILFASLPVLVGSKYCPTSEMTPDELGAIGEHPGQLAYYIILGKIYMIIGQYQLQMFHPYTYEQNGKQYLSMTVLDPVYYYTIKITLRLNRHGSKATNAEQNLQPCILRMTFPSTYLRSKTKSQQSNQTSSKAEDLKRTINVATLFIILGGYVRLDTLKERFFRKYVADDDALEAVWNEFYLSFTDIVTYCTDSPHPEPKENMTLGEQWDYRNQLMAPEPVADAIDPCCNYKTLLKRLMFKKFDIAGDVFDKIYDDNHFIISINDINVKIFSIFSNLFPHMNTFFEGIDNLSPIISAEKKYFVFSELCNAKLDYLAYLTVMFYEAKLGLKEQMSRDAFNVTRVKNEAKISDLFRPLWRLRTNTVERTLRLHAQMEYERIDGTDNYQLVVQKDANFDSKFTAAFEEGENILENIEKRFRNSTWPSTNAKKPETNVTQPFENLNAIAHIAHSGRVVKALQMKNLGSKAREVRADQQGMIDTLASPDGKGIGLTTNMTIWCRLANEIPANDMQNILKILKPLLSSNKQKGTVMLNWGIIGYGDVTKIYPQLLKHQRAGKIHPHASIYLTNESIIHIATSDPRLMQPLLIVGENGLLEIDNKKLRGKIEAFYPNSGCVEYVDAARAEWSRIAPSEGALLQQILLYRMAEIRLKLAFLSKDSKEIEDAIEKFDREAKKTKFTHCFIHGMCNFGIAINSTNFVSQNYAPRIAYQGGMEAQNMSIPHASWQRLMPSDTMKILLHPSCPPTSTVCERRFFFNNPRSINTHIAITNATSGGDGQEDSYVVSDVFSHCDARASKMGAKVTILKNVATSRIGLPPGGRDNAILSESGLRYIGSEIKPSKPICGVVVKETVNNQEELFDRSTRSGIYDYGRMLRHNIVSSSHVESSYVLTINAEPGGKGAMRPSQKGTFTVPRHIPHLIAGIDTGIVPNLMMNPHGIPSRGTLTPLIEAVTNTAAAIEGRIVDGTGFKHADLSKFYKILAKAKLPISCKEIMINGETGELMEVPIYTGVGIISPMKQLPLEKNIVRGRGAITAALAVLQGRKIGGGIRLGEMEIGALIAHGVAEIIKYITIKSADRFDCIICLNESCNAINSPCTSNSKFRCEVCGQDKFGVHTIPYSFMVVKHLLSAFNVNLSLQLAYKYADQIQRVATALVNDDTETVLTEITEIVEEEKENTDEVDEVIEDDEGDYYEEDEYTGEFEE